MNNVITIEKVNSIYTDVCLSSQADGSNAITVEIYPNNASNPQLKIYLNGTLETTANLINNAWNNVAISSSLFVANGIITFSFVDGSFSSDTFTINFPNSLNGNLMLSKTTDFTFDAKYTVEETYSDTKVTQNDSSSDADYRVLLSKSANDTTETEEANKNTNFRYNPSKKAVTIGTREDNTTIGNNSAVIGLDNEASNTCSFAEGYQTQASNSCSHSEGQHTISSGTASHAEGMSNTASGNSGSHAEGFSTTSSGTSSHSEGSNTTASGSNGAHAEGYYSTASGEASHSEGYYSKASGKYAHSEGRNTVAQRQSQHVFGEYNVLDTTGSSSTRGDFVEIVGNGTANNARDNARTLDWNGNEVLKGNLTTTDVKVPSGSTWDGTNTSLIAALAEKVSTSEFDNQYVTVETTQTNFYVNNIGSLKIMYFRDNFKINMSSGWTTLSNNGTAIKLASKYRPITEQYLTSYLPGGVGMTVRIKTDGSVLVWLSGAYSSTYTVRVNFIYI